MTNERLIDDPVLQRIRRVRPSISDDALSPTGAHAFAVLERVLAGDHQATAGRRPRARSGSVRVASRPRVLTRSPVFAALAVAAAAVTAVVLGIATGLLDSGTASVPPAAAAVLPRALAALEHRPGTIVEETTRTVSPSRPRMWVQTTFSEYPAGHGPQNVLSVYRSGHTPGDRVPGAETGIVNGEDEVYDPIRHTVYLKSNYGGSIKPGPRPGTYVLSSSRPHLHIHVLGWTPRPVQISASQAHALLDATDVEVAVAEPGHPHRIRLEIRRAPRGVAFDVRLVRADMRARIKPGPKPGTYLLMPESVPTAPKPIVITAAQRRALLDGTDMAAQVAVPGHPGQLQVKIRPQIVPSSETAELRSQLKRGDFRLAGQTTIDGRRALELVARDHTSRYYVAPGTYYPIESDLGVGPHRIVRTIYQLYRVFPATAANLRLLSCAARHPGARIDHHAADFNAAQLRLGIGS